MNKDILKTGVQDYINNNLNTDILSVLLKKSEFDTISSKELAQQIEGKKNVPLSFQPGSELQKYTTLQRLILNNLHLKRQPSIKQV